MGIILEEDIENSPGIVTIAKIDPNGNTAKTLRQSNSNQNQCMSLRDELVSIHSYNCINTSLEEVMEYILTSDQEIMDVTVRRNTRRTTIEFCNGISIATQSGESIRNLASLAFVNIQYSCDSGGCGTCEQTMRGMKQHFNEEDDEEKNINDVVWEQDRYIRPCIARVPKGYQRIVLFPSDRFDP